MNGHVSAVQDYDVIIIGAGISGLNTAYRIQTQAPPGTTYCILEARSQLGGTWDFFKYPGLRSDSDLQTFGFEWRPWGNLVSEGHAAIVDGGSIVKYLRTCAEETGIDKKIHFEHKVVAADWSSKQLKWTLDVDVNGQQKKFRGGFMVLGTGYYDYDTPLPAVIPGIERFKGQVVHPQFWPQDLDYTNKKMIIIGSGATAITMLPVIAKKASHVTMVQRSPTYIMALPSKDPLGNLIHKILPPSWAFTLNRLKYMMMGYFFFYFCRTFPNAGKKLIAAQTKKQLPPHVPLDPHFVPKYNPWEQRLCICPDGDFYTAIRKGKADVVTGNIKTVTEKGILMESGETLTTDIICTATGLKVHLAGGTKLSVDGIPLIIPEKFMWKGVMLQDLPNAAFVIGYTNASWTLGADATAHMITRLLNYMAKNGFKAAVPRVEEGEEMESTPMLNLNSTYLQRASGMMPKSGNKGQWRPRTNYFSDMSAARWGDITSGLEFLGKGTEEKQENGRVNGKI
ncbi:monooxygenase flavin-binding family protein-like protein [Tothia fuscella]|uniref:Monooxygenase flavin-binding family protein-like protein n=1 Tax=Tothia fuscella TaxID=1048955 RepID=A0A9P4NRM5_9PEZI|nr:monooxygenase flavin-binding family protein-like protein [Tothia fuscella]